MDTQPLRIAILFGGPSAEHEISLLSARNILAALGAPGSDNNSGPAHQLVPIGITRRGSWLFIPDWENALSPKGELPRALSEELGFRLFLVPGQTQPIRMLENQKPLDIDLVFPVLHGSYGEDGSLQGILKQLNLPFVGSGVLASAVGMDKEMTKRLMQGHVPVAKFITCKRQEQPDMDFAEAKAALGLPFYIKPANQGSSVGVHRISNSSDFKAGWQDAFRHDHKILLEENIEGRELECAVLGNAGPQASLVGEILPPQGFYSYQAKYLDSEATDLRVPAQLEEAEQRLLQATALKAFRLLGLAGLARVDMFLEPGGRVVLNEVNTMPGFTGISMYPALWAKSGWPLPRLLDRLIGLALESYDADRQLRLEPHGVHFASSSSLS